MGVTQSIRGHYDCVTRAAQTEHVKHGAMLREGKEETDMRLMIMVAILGVNLALTASAALAEGNADPPYIRTLIGISQPARIEGGTGASASGTVAGVATSQCPGCDREQEGSRQR